MSQTLFHSLNSHAGAAASLLPLRCWCCLLHVGGNHLAKHDCGVAVQEGNAGQTLAVLEAVHNQGLAGGENDLSHLVSLQGMGLLHLLTASLLSNLPVDLLHAAS